MKLHAFTGERYEPKCSYLKRALARDGSVRKFNRAVMRGLCCGGLCWRWARLVWCYGLNRTI